MNASPRTAALARYLRLVPWPAFGIAVAGLAFVLGRSSGTAARERALVARLDSMRTLLDEAAIARYQAERMYERADKYARNLVSGNAELERAYELERSASQEAVSQAAEAMRQSLAKEHALQREQVARKEEQVQRVLADARSDSIALEQQRTTEANQRLQASKLAQSSMNVKGATVPRALMAVQAVRLMHRSGGDVNKDELVLALQGALEELERKAPPGVEHLSAGPRWLACQDGGLLALGNDGVMTRVDLPDWRARTVQDRSGHAGRTGGRAFVSADLLLTANIDKGIAVAALKDGRVLAERSRTPHADDITAMAAFPGASTIVTGDRAGRLVWWNVQDGDLLPIKEESIGGTVRMLVAGSTARVIAINGTSTIRVLGPDGGIRPATVPDADRAHCATAGALGEFIIGTHMGRVLVLRPEGPGLDQVFGGHGQRIEALAVSPDGSRIAVADAVRTITIIERDRGSGSAFRMRSIGIPNAMAFGAEDNLYLAFDDRTIRPCFTSTRALARRICALAGRSWTGEEWARYVGEGAVEPACSEWP
jgi:hypothetical protein